MIEDDREMDPMRTPIRRPGLGTPGKFDAANDEPMPSTAPGQPIILGLVVQDLCRRAEVGVGSYGELLRAGNGRKALRDLYAELLDAAMYIRQLIEEEEGEKKVEP